MPLRAIVCGLRQNLILSDSLTPSTSEPKCQAEKGSQVWQIELRDFFGDLREIEMLSVSQEVLDHPDGVLASHLTGLLVKPLLQLRARNLVG